MKVEDENNKNNNGNADDVDVDDEIQPAENAERNDNDNDNKDTLERKFAGLSPNVSEIAEYATKDREYGTQMQELDGLPARRDAARRQCYRLRNA